MVFLPRRVVLDSTRPGRETPCDKKKDRVEERIIKSIPAFLALLALLLPAAAAAQSTAATGRNLAAACASCHGTNGFAADGMPSLAGKPREYLTRTLKDYREGRLPGTLMPQLARGYTDAQIEALAGYLSAQKDER